MKGEMMDQALPPLLYPEGWKDILNSADAADYQRQLDQICALTEQAVNEPWVRSRWDVLRRWQTVIEGIAAFAIFPEDRETMTESEIIETALITLFETLAAAGWDETGCSVAILDLATGETMRFDVRHPLDPRKIAEG